MRRILLTIVVLILSASTAFAQYGRIGLFSDVTGTDCSMVDDTAGLRTMRVVNILTPGSTAVQYAAPVPACFTAAVWLSDTPVFGVNIGNSQQGISTAFGACLGPTVHVLTINVFAQALAGACCVWPVIENQDSGELVVVDCVPAAQTTVGQSGLINPSAPLGGCECSDIVATRTTTWGGLKALFNSQSAN